MTFRGIEANQINPKIGKFIDIYLPIAGHKAIQCWWNPEGFWEPWDTSPCAFKTAKGAYKYAKMWAESDNLPYVIHPEFED